MQKQMKAEEINGDLDETLQKSISLLVTFLEKGRFSVATIAPYCIDYHTGLHHKI
jgi:hypothetical protein